MNKNNKAWMRIIGVVLASVLIFVYIMFVQRIQLVEETQPSAWDTTLLRIYGNDVLKAFDLKDDDVDYKGDLRELVVAGNWSNITSGLDKMLPQNIKYTLYLYDSDGNITYKGGVTPSNIPIKKEKVSIDYMIAGSAGEPCYNNQSCSLFLVLWFV